ncbi:uncharacterized protein LOC118418574 [Branchiostoma floridae]|uniref:Uncharacterized protein LOC118418574 n=1 Tax=Branchiostoma floridae TaxID=7739 RepID=A0A9J7LF65_BRAFL|nr:uncharacterized protein LOC118418574 [Branchiostoma floridae]
MKTVILSAILFLLSGANIAESRTQSPTATSTQAPTTTPCPGPSTVTINGDYLRIVGTADEAVLFEATVEPYHSCYQGQLRYSWHCRRNASNSTPAPVARYAPSSVDSSGNNVYTDACGDVDFRELSGAGSAIRLNQSTMDSGATYVIKVNATVEGASTDFAQELHIIDGGSLPTFSISCRENCGEVLKLVKDFKLEVSCTTGCTEVRASSSRSGWWNNGRRNNGRRRSNNWQTTTRISWSYHWRLYEENIETGDVTEIPNLAEMTSSGINRNDLQVQKYKLEPSKKYRFRVKASKSDGSKWSFMEYHILSGPKSSVNCSVIPKTGFAAGTGFTITNDVPADVTSEENIDYSFYSGYNLLSEQQSSVAGPYRLQSGDANKDFVVTIKVQARGDEGFYSECSVNASVLPSVKPPVGLWQDALSWAYEAEVTIDQGDAAAAATLAVGIVDLLEQLLSPDLDPAQTLRDQGNGDLLDEALNSSIHHPSPTVRPVNPGYVFSQDWSSATTIDEINNMLPPGTPGSGEDKLQLFVRSNLIDKLSDRANDLSDASSLQQGTDGMVKLLGTGEFVYVESQFLAVESLHQYATNLNLAVLAGDQIDGDQVYQISEGIHNGIGAVLRNIMDEAGISGTSSAISWPSTLRTVVGHFEEVTDMLASLVLRSSLSDSPPVVFDLPMGTVLYQKHKTENIQQGEFATERSEGFVTLPDSYAVFGTGSNESIVNSKFVAFPRNPMTWDPATEPRSSVLSLDFYDETGHRLPVEDTAQPLEVTVTGSASGLGPVSPSAPWRMMPALDEVPEPAFIPVYTVIWFYIQNYDKPGFPNVTFMNETTVAANGLTYHKMEVDNETTPTPVLVMLIPPPHVIAYQVYMQYNEPPTPDNHNFTATIPPLERACDVSIPELSGRDVTAMFPWVFPEVNGTYYIGVKELGHKECRRVPGVSYAEVKSKINNAPDDESYSLAILTPQCVWWDKTGEGQWDPSECTVGPNTTVDHTQCLTTHLTSFGSDFMVPPNSIDFSTVFAKFANLSDNAAVFSTVIVMFGLYFIIVFFLFKADKRDRIKWGVLPIADNNESDENFYLLTVYTGMKAGSGTSSKAGIILHGADGDTGARPLAASKNQVFKRGSISSFLLSTSAELGDLTHLHVWHDNSGAGGDSSWFLDKIVVGDLQSDRRQVPQS